jgi:hypothetical protein
LRGDDEPHGIRAAGRDRHADVYRLAVGLRVTEELVGLALTRGQFCRAELGVLSLEAESLAIHVIAVRNLEADLDRVRRQGTRRKAERLLGLEQILLRQRRGRHARECEPQEQDSRHWAGWVCAATQSR